MRFLNIRSCNTRLTSSRGLRQVHNVAVSSTTTTAERWTTHKWQWKDYSINYAVAGCGAPVLLVHGFGVNYMQWRNTIRAVAKDHKVYAIDLLGFGQSDKAPIDYSIELWAQQVQDFCQEFVKAPVTLVGNSIGSLVSLEAAQMMDNAESGPKVQGIALINCAGGMNNKARTDDWRVKLAFPLFVLIEIILKTRFIFQPLFDSFRTPENVRTALENLYCNPDQVDDELVNSVCRPADDEGAMDVLVSVYTGPPGPKPEPILESTEAPVLILWGDMDPLTPVDGPVGQFCQQLPERRENIQFQLLPNSGHCAMDDTPEQVDTHLLPWLAKIHSQ